MRNEQGFFRIDQALISLHNGSLKNMPDVQIIREEIEILKKFIEFTEKLQDKLSRRNKLIAHLREEHTKRGEKIVELSKELQGAEERENG